MVTTTTMIIVIIIAEILKTFLKKAQNVWIKTWRELGFGDCGENVQREHAVLVGRIVKLRP